MTNSTSDASPTSVYRYYDAAGRILYVGVTARGDKRLQEHAATKAWWRLVASSSVDHYANRAQALAQEAALIKAHRPPFNTVHHPAPEVALMNYVRTMPKHCRGSLMSDRVRLQPCIECGEPIGESGGPRCYWCWNADVVERQLRRFVEDPQRRGDMAHPTDNLVRLAALPASLRGEDMLGAPTDPSAGGTVLGNTLYGHFAVFNTWTEISSWFEGNFLERIAPGAFKQTFADKANQIRVLYDHGNDPSVGNKPLGKPLVLKEDRTGAYYEVGLFDAEYVCELKPAIAAGQMGASFRFKVVAEEWVRPTEPSDYNPAKLEERTITAVELYEFGPVTFPAYAEATAGLRSRTDEFAERLLHDPVALTRFIDRVGPRNAARVLLDVAASGPQPTDSAASGPKPVSGRLLASLRTHLLSLKGA